MFEHSGKASKILKLPFVRQS